VAGEKERRGGAGMAADAFSFEGGSVVRCEKEGGKGALRAWPHGEGGGGMRGALARRSAVRGGQQRPSAIGRGWRHCCVNREGGGHGRCGRAADVRARASGGPGVSGRVRERVGREAGHRHVGQGGTVLGGADSNQISNKIRIQMFQTVLNFGQLEKYFPSSEKLKQNMVSKISER
jgi:hypothetical protein